MNDFTAGPTRYPSPGGRSSAPTDDDHGARGRDDADAGDDAGTGHEPPASPEEHTAVVLALKVSLAMFLADLVARKAGFDSPTWSVVTAAYLATSAPFDSLRAAGKKLLALAAGIALGALGAYAAGWLSGVPSLHFALVGIVAGALASRSSDYIFTAVVGTVVTFVGSGGGDPLPEVVTTTACMVAIGCVIGPAVVWTVERARRAWTERAT